MVFIRSLNVTVNSDIQAQTKNIKSLPDGNIIVNINDLTPLVSYNLIYNFDISKDYKYYKIIINKKIKSKLLSLRGKTTISGSFTFLDLESFNMYSFHLQLYNKNKDKVKKVSIANFTVIPITVLTFRTVTESVTKNINVFNSQI
jgi:hypothetical protein